MAILTKSFRRVFLPRTIDKVWPMVSKRSEKGSTSSKKITMGLNPRTLNPSNKEKGAVATSRAEDHCSVIVIYKERVTEKRYKINFSDAK